MLRWLTVASLLISTVHSCDPTRELCGEVAAGKAADLRKDLWQILNGATNNNISYLKRAYSNSDLVKLEDINGTQILADAAKNLNKILKSKTEAVNSIAEFVRQKSTTMVGTEAVPDRVDESTYSCPSYILAKDSTMGDRINLTYIEEFKAEVNLSKTVIHFPVDVYEYSKGIRSAVKLTDGLEKVFVNNYGNDRFIFAQYFGSTSGLLRYFPAYYWETNNQTDLYDCRFRSWYIEAAGQPRDVVFLMDKSGSMFGWALRVAKYTAKRLLSIISDKDHIAFYTFNETTTSLSCKKDLERARLKYITYLTDQIDTISAYGPSNITTALRRAFGVLRESRTKNKTCDCQRAIVIFSDYLRQDYSELLQELNPDGKVKIFILAFGSPNQGDTSKLEEIACTNNGYFSKVYTFGDVVPAISNILAVFGQPLSTNIPDIQVSWSTVYYEYDRQNFVMTVGKSVVLDIKNINTTNKGAPFLGVAAIDVDIPQMKAIMTGMFSGIMYAFMINNNGVVVLHPRMVPIDGYTEKPDLDLNDIEVTENPEDIIDITKIMLNRRTMGFKTRSLLYFPDTIRGRETYQDTELFVTSLEEHPFSIGIVVPSSERKKTTVVKEKLNKNIIKETIRREVPGTLRWKKYPLCKKNISDTIQLPQSVPELQSDPCWPDRYYQMAAEIQITNPIAQWWRTEQFEKWRTTLPNLNECSECIMDVYLVTNIGITRTYRNMTRPGTVIDPTEMQPFRHSRKGLPPDILLVSLLDKQTEDKIYFNLSYSVGVRNDASDDFYQPVAVGVKVQFKALRYLVRKTLGSSYQNVSVTLLDENAFIIYSTDSLWRTTSVDRFFDKISPITKLVDRSGFYLNYTVVDCQKLCPKNPVQEQSRVASSSSSMVRLISPLSILQVVLGTLWRTLLTLWLWAGETPPVAPTHMSSTQFMCCVDNIAYIRDFDRTDPYEGSADCGACTKNITLAPLPGSNVLLLIDNSPDCICPEQARNRTKYFRKLCENPVSQWQSDLTLRDCFEKNNKTVPPGTWYCSKDSKTYTRTLTSPDD